MNYTALKDIIADYEARLNALKENLDEHKKENFYDAGLDEYGMPYSFGNADDVYSDGFENGIKDGSLDAFNEIITKLKALL